MPLHAHVAADGTFHDEGFSGNHEVVTWKVTVAGGQLITTRHEIAASAGGHVPKRILFVTSPETAENLGKCAQGSVTKPVTKSR